MCGLSSHGLLGGRAPFLIINLNIIQTIQNVYLETPVCLLIPFRMTTRENLRKIIQIKIFFLHFEPKVLKLDSPKSNLFCKHFDIICSSTSSSCFRGYRKISRHTDIKNHESKWFFFSFQTFLNPTNFTYNEGLLWIAGPRYLSFCLFDNLALTNTKDNWWAKNVEYT